MAAALYSLPPLFARMALHHIIYLSRATQPFSEDDLRALLEEARQHNAAQHITGALVYGNGQFAQIIEGQESALTALYERLLLDPRHAQLVKFADKAIDHRSFANWSMAFGAVSEEQLRSLAAYVPLAELNLEPANLSVTDTMVLKMMKSFVLPPMAEEQA